MAEHSERWVLDHLMEICKDGERGLRHAAGYVREASTKAVLMDLALRRAQLRAELLPHAHRLGSTADSQGTTTGALHRGWMSVADVATGHDEEAILREAERGERAAVAAYEDAVNGMLPPTSRDVIERQFFELLQAYRRVQTLLSHSAALP